MAEEDEKIGSLLSGLTLFLVVFLAFNVLFIWRQPVFFEDFIKPFWEFIGFLGIVRVLADFVTVVFRDYFVFLVFLVFVFFAWTASQPTRAASSAKK